MQLFNDLFVFFKIVFLGNSMLLTQNPIDLSNSWLDISPKNPIRLVTMGAHFSVNINIDNAIFNEIRNFEYNEFNLQKKFSGKLFIRLVDVDDNKFILNNIDFATNSLDLSKINKNNYIYFNMNMNKKIKENMEFKKIFIKSNIKIKSVKVFWVNYKL